MASSADKVIEQIARDIETGVLRPGDQIDEAALSAKFGVSRTPLREAVRSLVNSGVLMTRPRKGAMVRVLTTKELLDLFELSAELEGMASRLAALTLTEAKSRQIESRLKECHSAAQDEDLHRYSAANLAFHRAIHVASSNDALVDHLSKIQIHINPYRFMPYEIRGRINASVKEHDEIFEAILGGDENEACELMKKHMMLQGRRLPAIVESLQEFANP